MLHKVMQNRWGRLAVAVFGTFLYAVGLNLFIVPMDLYSGGIMGVTQILRTLIARRVALPTNIDILGILYFIFNIPLLLFAWRKLGRQFVLRTLICTVSSSLFLSLITAPATPILDERLACCVVGGIVCGFGLGLALTCGCTSGGLDIIGYYLSKRGSRFTVGRFSLGFNAVLYTLCALLFDVPTAIYSVIYLVFASLFVDRTHEQNINLQMLIFTHNEDPELPKQIMTRLGRGVTYWEGKGAYTERDLRVLCVCVSKFEENELRGIVLSLDPHAFFIVQEGVRIGGNFARKLS